MGRRPLVEKGTGILHEVSFQNGRTLAQAGVGGQVFKDRGVLDGKLK